MSEGCEHSPGRDRAAVGRVTDALRQSSRKVTEPRRQILEILGSHQHPRTIREIQFELGDGGCDMATIYRSMHLLLEIGMVQRFDFGDGAARFELVRGGAAHHHHHVICTQCSVVVELDECAMKEVDEVVSTKSLFLAISHRLEFFGICPGCQAVAVKK